MYLVRLTDPCGERSPRWLRRQPADHDWTANQFLAEMSPDEAGAWRALRDAKRRCGRKLAIWRCEVVQQEWGMA